MQPVSINTRHRSRISYLVRNLFVERIYNMQMILLIACIADSARGIIVKDPPMSSNEYKYSYDIEDPTTGDTKSQYEVGQGNVVSGAYSVLDPDGTRRTVHYTADPKYGFKAIVTQEPVEAVMVVREPTIRLSQELSADNCEFSYSHYSVLDDDPIDTDLYAQVSLPDLESSLTYFTPVNELKNNKRTENGQYFTPNRN